MMSNKQPETGQGSGNYSDAYEKGKNAAVDGKTLQENPYLHGNDSGTEIQFWAWLNGFKDHQTFDPKCRYCAGTGYFSLSSRDNEDLPREWCLTTLTTLRCSCNIGKVKKTDTS